MELSPGDVDRSIGRHPYGLVIRELAIRSFGDSLTVERADQCQWLPRPSPQPGDAAVRRATQQEPRIGAVVAEAGKVSRPVRSKRDRGIAAEISVSCSRNGGVVGEAGDSGDKPVW